MKKAVLKNFAIFSGKLQPCNFIKNTLQQRCFLLNIVKFLRTPVSKNICSVGSCFCIDSFIKVNRSVYIAKSKQRYHAPNHP